MPKEIVIFEPDSSGHQKDHLDATMNEIVRRLPGVPVALITTAESAAHPSIARILAAYAGTMRAVTPEVPDPPAWLARLIGRYTTYRLKNVWLMRAGLRQIGLSRIGIVLIAHAESIGLPLLALWLRMCLGLPWMTVSVGMRFHHAAAGVVGPVRRTDIAQNLLFRIIMLNPWLTAFGSVDPFLKPVTGQAKVLYTPGPCSVLLNTTRAEARRFYGIRPDSFVVLVFGYLDHRKRLDLLLDACLKVDPAIDITVFLAGHQQKRDLGAIMAGPSAQALRAAGRLVEANRFIEEDHDPEPLLAADVTWIHYNPEFVYLSGVLLRSYRVGVPVIYNRIGVNGRLLEEAQCGLPVAEPTPDAVAAVLTQAATHPAMLAELAARGHSAFDGFTPEAHGRPIAELMAGVLGVGR
jgi:glycosyltransferase involved in cell wall biosynthesis